MNYLTATEILDREYVMATIVEIRQKLVQGGMQVADAQQAARILADMPAFTEPTGNLWDTIRAKGYRMTARPTGTIFRLITNDKLNGIVMLKDGLSTIFIETTVDKL